MSYLPLYFFRAKLIMDIATFCGIFSAFGLVILAIYLGGGLNLFFNFPSFLIVLGGTVGATLINYPFKDVVGAFSVLKHVFLSKKQSTGTIIKMFIEYAQKARREGILALEYDVAAIEDPFFKKGVQLSIDGLEPDDIQEILLTEITFLKERHQLGAEIFSTMGAFSPALGMIGTLIGLVQMLQSMNDPSRIGPAMAVALLTTFYGSILANLVFLPVAGKLRTRSREEAQKCEMMMTGVIALSNGDNPRILEQKMMVYLPPKMRISNFD